MKPDATPTLKICLLGEYGVGKSSLANRWVFDQFSEVYTSTIGVRTLACTAVWQDRTAAALRRLGRSRGAVIIGADASLLGVQIFHYSSPTGCVRVP